MRHKRRSFGAALDTRAPTSHQERRSSPGAPSGAADRRLAILRPPRSPSAKQGTGSPRRRGGQASPDLGGPRSPLASQGSRPPFGDLRDRVPASLRRSSRQGRGLPTEIQTGSPVSWEPSCVQGLRSPLERTSALILSTSSTSSTSSTLSERALWDSMWSSTLSSPVSHG
jgi:hypothetical protein